MYKADLIKGEMVTRRLLEDRGRRLRFFRHPSLRSGPTAEYKTALEHVIAHFEGLSRRFLGYEIPQVFLLHAHELNADFLPDVVRMLRGRGYRFISLNEASAALEHPSIGGAVRRTSDARDTQSGDRADRPVGLKRKRRARLTGPA